MATTKKPPELQAPDLVIELSKSYFYELVEGNDDAPLLTLPLGIVSRDVMHSYMSPDWIQSSSQAARDVSISLTKAHSVELPAGLTIVMGKAGSGKTLLTLQRMTMLNEAVTYHRYAEPLDAGFTRAARENPNRVELLFTEQELANRIATLLIGGPAGEVMVIDSLRYWVFTPGGATGKGGVNMSLFTALTHLDILCTLLGKTLIVVLNPLTDDKAAYDQIVEVALGSCSGVIDVTSPTQISVNTRSNGRRWVNKSLGSLAAVVEKNQDFSTLINDQSTIDIAKFGR